MTDTDKINRTGFGVRVQFVLSSPTTQELGQVAAHCVNNAADEGAGTGVCKQAYLKIRAQSDQYFGPSPQAKHRGEGGSVRSTETGEEETGN